jgi:hypothetical protein
MPDTATQLPPPPSVTPSGLPFRQLRVRYYRLLDKARHKSVRKRADAIAMNTMASLIHSSQDAVSLQFQGFEDVTLPGNQGARPNASVMMGVLDGLFRSRRLNRRRADLHAFLIWDLADDLGLDPGPKPGSGYGQSDDGDSDSGSTPAPGGSGGGGGSAAPPTLGVTVASLHICILADCPPSVEGKVLAHEVGHFLTPGLLGMFGHDPDPQNLMFPVQVGGTKLNPSQCLMMNSNAVFATAAFAPVP